MSEDRRPKFSDNAARNISGTGFDFEYGPKDTPDVERNVAEGVGKNGTGFRGRVVQTGTPTRTPWWKAAGLWIIKTTTGKIVGSLVTALLAASGVIGYIKGWIG